MNDDRHGSPNEEERWSCDRVRDEMDGWALGALEPGERELVERHLAACEPCREDAAREGAVASLLPLSLTPVSPSAEAKRSLMARIADEQMAVVVAQEQVRLPRPMSTPAPAEPVRSLPRYHWSQLLVAPLAVALLVMSLWAFDLQQRVDDAGGDTGPAQLISAPLPEGFQTYTMKSDCEKCNSAGTLLADPQQADALMVAWDLDPTQVHQVWCEEGDGSKVMIASLNVSDTGEVVQPLVFDQPIAGYSRIYVVNNNGETVEINMDADKPRLVSSPVPAERR